MKNELNSKIWNSDLTINQSVRKNLLKIAKDFVQYVKIKNIKIVDIILTGSLANFNWHSKSDIDLHIVVDLSNFGKHENFIEEYLQTKKSLWNYLHEIYIFGFEVEIYPENKSKNQKSNGMFSIIKNKWIVRPLKKEVEIDDNELNSKYIEEVKRINYFEEQSKKKNLDYEKLLDKIDKYKEKWRNKRAKAIKEEGENSIDNLIFKKLRKNNYLKKLTDLQISIYDNALTLERIREAIKYEFVSVGEKFYLNRNIARLHGKAGDRYKIIKEVKNNMSIRNLRNRKDYIIEVDILKSFLIKKFIIKE